MSKGKSLFFLIALAGVVLFFSPKNALASEGTTNLRSLNNEPYRCWAASSINERGVYVILLNCRDIFYPAGAYVVWASQLDGVQKNLGTIDYGRREFSSKVPFSGLYVTIEGNPKAKSPEGTVVMRGSVESIHFLEEQSPEETPTPTLAEDQAQKEQPQEEEIKVLSTREKIFLALKRAGIAAILALIAIIGLIFVITRK